MFKRKLDQSGLASATVIPMIALGLMTVILLGLTVYLFIRVDESENSRDQFAQEAVEEAKLQQKKELEADFLQREKEPNSTFEGAEILGNIQFKYPKTWSAVLDEEIDGSTQIDAIFHPGIVQTDESDQRSYALRLQLIDDQYSEVLEDYEDLIEDGELKTRGVTFNGNEGIRLDGQLEEVDRGSMIILPLRDKTIRFWTESPEFQADYEKILGTFNFNP